jgi:hypothetical protein
LTTETRCGGHRFSSPSCPGIGGSPRQVSRRLSSERSAQPAYHGFQRVPLPVHLLQQGNMGAVPATSQGGLGPGRDTVAERYLQGERDILPGRYVER